ncbi:MAG TPA: hypothetical protein VML75_27275 [Kofleriaceae bacterium]|nr:hypothetical protein [Kofleriaceae bacterium]
MIDDFLAHSETEDAKLARAFAKLSGDARDSFGALLGRFDYTHTGSLDADERALARRVLTLMHTPSGKGLELLVSILDYLDVNENQKLEHTELNLAVEILEMFCKADSVNNTLSARELEMLHAVLKSRDPAGRGTLDEAARLELRDALWDPDAFLAREKQHNPALAALLA